MKDTILDLHKRGLTTKQIAKTLQIYPELVEKITKPKKKREPLKQKIIELRDQGKTYKIIAQELGCSKSTVCLICQNREGNKEISSKNRKENPPSYKKAVRWAKDVYDSEIINAAKDTICLSECVNKLGFNSHGSSSSMHWRIRRMIKEKKLDVSHWIKNNWEKTKKNTEDLRDDRQRKIRLIKELGRKCINCGISEWMGEPVPLDLHHIDEDRKNNKKENLTLLCKNCHGIKHKQNKT